ncbi:MAG: AAA family ATPase, partial [Actinobacteria bacterium]|nr:AAA family ATPase [Actinomycetota bacterium]
GWVDAVMFDGKKSAEAAIREVKIAGVGPAAIVTANGEDPAGPLISDLGLEALVDLTGPGADKGVAASFLGDVVLARGWVSAWETARNHPQIRVVTPEGDMFTAHGIHLARPDDAGPMLERARAGHEEALIEEARALSRLNTARRAFETSRERERGSLETLEAAEAALAGRVEAMSRLGQSVAGIETEIARLGERREALEEAIDAAQTRGRALSERIRALTGEEAERLREWEALEGRRADVAAERERARSEWQDAAGRRHGVEERLEVLTSRKGRLNEELARLERVGGADVGTMARVEQTAGEAIEVLGDRLAKLRTRQAGLREMTEAASTALAERTAARERHRSLLDQDRRRLGELDVGITELRMSREAMLEAIRRDAGEAVDAAYAASAPDYPEGTNLEEVLETRLAELTRLGPVNPLAAAEYAELVGRHEFLNAQIADVEGSRSELRKVISALDREIGERFEAAYRDVAAAFEQYFTILFPGGRGRVRLVDPADPASGVVIEAQPLGKKVSQLGLLSGGERSLVALAFLFAVFEARPSPFYVLDEVEAALDDVNLRRFIRIVDQFRERAQLVIVTHQQQTMEAADVLYGVTMEPGGASQAFRKDMTTLVDVR